MNNDQAKQVPLVELLDEVPADVRIGVEDGEGWQAGTTWHPIGQLCHEAAAELRRLHDLLGKANALARIRAKRIAELEEQLQSMITCFERWEDTNTAQVMDAARAAIRARGNK